MDSNAPPRQKEGRCWQGCSVLEVELVELLGVFWMATHFLLCCIIVLIDSSQAVATLHGVPSLLEAFRSSITHSILKGSCVTFPSRPSWSRGFLFKRHVTTLHAVGKIDKNFLLKGNVSLSEGVSQTRGLKRKRFKISAFKGGVHEDSGGKASGSNISKDSAKISYAPKENEEIITEPRQAHNGPLSFTSEMNETVAGSDAISKLFKKWLTLLRSESPSQVKNGLLEGQPPRNIVETKIGSRSDRQGILKKVASYFWSLDATIKTPLLIFFPLYMAVNVMYGAEVSKELTPLWIVGPLLVALYIRVLQGLWALYVFCYKQVVKLAENAPRYSTLAYDYIANGKLKEDVMLPVLAVKNTDYRELWRTKMKEFQEWMAESYLDFLESIWPYYCRTIRFLKRANFI